MQFNEMVARMSRDKRLDGYDSQKLTSLFSETLRPLAREAQRTVLKDLKCRFKEQQISLASGERAVNLPDDFMVMEEARYRLSTDSDNVEGQLIEIKDVSELF